MDDSESINSAGEENSEEGIIQKNIIHLQMKKIN